MQRVAELEEERDKAEEERDALLGEKEKLTGELAGMREAAHEAVRQVRLEQVKVGRKQEGGGGGGRRTRMRAYSLCARVVQRRASIEFYSSCTPTRGFEPRALYSQRRSFEQRTLYKVPPTPAVSRTKIAFITDNTNRYCSCRF